MSAAATILPPRPVYCWRCKREIFQSIDGTWKDGEGYSLCPAAPFLSRHAPEEES